MNKNLFKSVSSELREAFIDAQEECKKMQILSITVENFLHSYLLPILRGEKECENKSVREFLDLLDEIERHYVIEKVQDAYKEQSSRRMVEVNVFRSVKDDVCFFEKEFNDIIDDALTYTEKVFPERLGKLESDVLLFCILSSQLHDKSEHDDDEVPCLAEVLFERCELTLKDLEDAMTRNSNPRKTFADALADMVTRHTGINHAEAAKIVDEVEKSVLKSKRIEPEPNAATQNSINEDDQNFEKYGDKRAFSGTEVDPNSDTPILDSFAVDYTRKAKDGQFDPVIGRDDVVDSIIEVLTKRKKNSAVITGPAGGGKSAVVERLAQRIVSGEVPEKMKGIRLCALNINDLVAGTQYRGQFEERIQKIIKEVVSKKGEIVIFIDELHNIVNAGSSGPGDMANILKPYLARGEFQCIGATTSEEYHRYIEKDAALNRRFTQIEVVEPNNEETLKILKGIQPQYEKFHRVRFGKEALEMTVEWSGRYISDKNFPDKAIDVLDMAGSLVSLRKIAEKDGPSELEEKLKIIIQDKIQAVTVDFDFAKAEQLKAEEEKIRAEIAKEEKARSKVTENRKNWMEVTLDDVATAVSKLSRVPVDKINQTDNEKLSKMKKDLEYRVIGQQEAIDVIVQAIQLNVLGLRDQKKPLCSLLAVGPSGVGKTLISQEVAEIFFGSERALIKIDGGEFKEEHSLSKLIGAPAGYVGHDSTEPLLLAVKRTPRSLVLIDEVEKMHESLYDVWLSILDTGKCKLADGEVIDFTNCIIIFTGNIGTKELKNTLNIGFGVSQDDKAKKDKSTVMKAVEGQFRPEFINRLSNIVVFNSLGTKEMDRIFNLELDKIKKRLSKSKVSIKVTPKLKSWIIEKCDKSYGARDLQRGITKYVVAPVGKTMLENPQQTKFSVDLDENTKEGVVGGA